MTTDNTTTAQAKRPRGRPAGPTKPADQLCTEVIRMRATKAEAAKYKAVGGPEWLRPALRRAKAPA